MGQLLADKKIPLPVGLLSVRSRTSKARFTIVDDCVLLKTEAKRNKHLDLSDFPDRTGFEASVNHIHLPFDGSAKSLQSSLSFATELRDALSVFDPTRRFAVILSVSPQGSVVRFHQIRPREQWLNDDLDSYQDESVLVLT
jgi:hypothetical protein